MSITTKHIIYEISTFFVTGLIGFFVSSWAGFVDSQSFIIALIIGYIFYSFMVLRRGITRANKFLSYKTEILILPKWGNLIEFGNKHFEVKNVFHKIRDKVEKELGVKFGEGGFGTPEFKWATEVKQGAEKIPDAFIVKGAARFITQSGLIWSDLQKTFFTDLGFQEKVFGGYGGPEPYLWMEVTKPSFNPETKKFERGGVLRFSWNQEKEICTFPLGSIRAFDAISGKEVAHPNFLEDIAKSGFKFSTDLGYDVYENEFFIIKFKEIGTS